MAQTQEAAPQVGAVYSLQGTLTEACSCNVLCPCWIGEDPDGGECFAIVAWHIDSGQVTGIDVSGRSLVAVAHIPGNILAGNWELVLLVDEHTNPEQRDALVKVFSGQLGGPLADFAQLIGTVKGSRASPSASRSAAAPERCIPGIVEAEMEPYRSPLGDVTTLRDSIFSTVPGSPAWVSKATRHRVNLPQYGMSWEYEGRNAIQAEWKMEHVA